MLDTHTWVAFLHCISICVFTRLFNFYCPLPRLTLLRLTLSELSKHPDNLTIEDVTELREKVNFLKINYYQSYLNATEMGTEEHWTELLGHEITSPVLKQVRMRIRFQNSRCTGQWTIDEFRRMKTVEFWTQILNYGLDEKSVVPILTTCVPARWHEQVSWRTAIPSTS